MVISIVAEKVSDKIQHLIVVKTFNKLGTEGNHLSIMKAIKSSYN